ncbi:hypothetical protein J3458_000693 [Metarhizium acridum]|uniref:uncharacterized protein n=1 Tax=Metarhizium acridum TaxID=92637 RepID=UPI001C6CAE81|nr:hypothetical protein J3458_000693 [Metarhizium acridum]
MEAQSTGASDVLSETVVNTEPVKEKRWHRMTDRRSIAQIIIAAIIGVATGLIISTQVPDRSKLQSAGNCLVPLPDQSWLGTFKAVVVVLLAVFSTMPTIRRVLQVVKDESSLPMWFVGFFITTTVFAIVLGWFMLFLAWVKISAVSMRDKGDVLVEEAVADTGAIFQDDDVWWVLLVGSWLIFW